MMLIFLVSCSNELSISEIPIPEEYKNMYDIEQRFEIYLNWAEKIPSDKIELYGTYMDSLVYLSFISPNLIIRDLFTQEEIEDVYDRNNPKDKEKFAIYCVQMDRQYSHLLLFNKGEFTMIPLFDYLKALKELIAYFQQHKDIDERLLPLCVQEITKMYVGNVRSYKEIGPWRHWWDDEADSLGRIYNKYLKYH